MCGSGAAIRIPEALSGLTGAEDGKEKEARMGGGRAEGKRRMRRGGEEGSGRTETSRNPIKHKGERPLR